MLSSCGKVRAGCSIPGPCNRSLCGAGEMIIISNNCYFCSMVKKSNKAEYKPAPLDLSDVRLPESLIGLTEAIAENTHETWSLNRMQDGWTYGPERDDKALKHPGLRPYSELPDSEKEYDRSTAMNAIKLIVKLGYRIEKNQ